MNGLIFTYVLTYCGSVVALFNPFYGLLIYICFAIIKPPALWSWAVPPGNYSRIIGIALLVGWALKGFGDQSFGKAKSVMLAAMGYYAFVIMSTMASSYPEQGTPFIEYFGKILLPMIAGLTLIHSWKQIEQLMWVMIGSAAFLAYECNLMYLRGTSVEQYGFLGVDNNTFAIFVVTAFGLAFVRGFEDPKPLFRWGYFAIAAAMAHVPMLAFSRGGMLGIATAAAVAVVLTPKNRRVWLTITAAAGVGSILAGPSVIEEFSTSFAAEEERDASAQSRVDLWRDCTDAALRSPLFGIGQGAWKAVAHTYGWPPGKAAHSLWFQAAAEVGLFGVGFLVLFYFLVVRNAWRLTKSPEPEVQTLGRMVISSTLGFAVCASFLSVDGLEFPYYVALLGACATKLHAEYAIPEGDFVPAFAA